MRCLRSLAWLSFPRFSLGVWLFALLPSVSRAEPNSLAHDYSALIDKALAEVRDNHFAEARALFARAHALYPNARTLRGLAVMSYELHAYAESLDYFEAALSSQETRLDDALRADAESRMRRARRSVLILHLSLTPAEQQLRVDGKEIVLKPSRELRLDVGAHTLSFEAPGYQSQTRTLDARAGQKMAWNISLEASTPPFDVAAATPRADTSELRPALASPQAPHKERAKLYKNPWLWVGVVVAAAAIGTAIGVTSAPHEKTKDPIETRYSPPQSIIQTLAGAR
jgi:tetratricopeptide (TPR) repeat protein